MKRILFALTLVMFLMAGAGHAAEDEHTVVLAGSGQLSEEDRQLLEMLELLQNYDLLDEIDILSVMEEEQ